MPPFQDHIPKHGHFGAVAKNSIQMSDRSKHVYMIVLWDASESQSMYI